MTMQMPRPSDQNKSDISEKPRVLYLDDDDSNLISFRANFRDQFEVFTSNNPVEAYNMIGEQKIQIVITDHNMPSMSGVEFLESIAEHYPEAQRIILTGYTEMVPLMEAVNKGKVFRIIAKPFNMKEISTMVSEAWDQFKIVFEREKMIKQLMRQNQQFEFILRQRLLT
jgi:response regulator RpfG family c-di-GMP phosphodiesterase